MGVQYNPHKGKCTMCMIGLEIAFGYKPPTDLDRDPNSWWACSCGVRYPPQGSILDVAEVITPYKIARFFGAQPKTIEKGRCLVLAPVIQDNLHGVWVTKDLNFSLPDFSLEEQRRMYLSLLTSELRIIAGYQVFRLLLDQTSISYRVVGGHPGFFGDIEQLRMRYTD